MTKPEDAGLFFGLQLWRESDADKLFLDTFRIRNKKRDLDGNVARYIYACIALHYDRL